MLLMKVTMVTTLYSGCIAYPMRFTIVTEYVVCMSDIILVVV